MKLQLKRTDFTDKSTIGDLYIDGKFFCYVLEDKDRGLTSEMPLVIIQGKKLFGITAIPYGTYTVELSMSNRFKRLLPAILGVKGYEGIRIHRGNTAADSLGCLIVGNKKAYDTVFESTACETLLVEKLKTAKDKITLEIIK